MEDYLLDLQHESEYLLLEKETWLEIRGIMMVFSMKLTSLIADLPGPNLPGLSAYFGFLLGYQEALSFRSSHYFVCYLSEAFMIAGGYKDFAYHFEEAYWKLSITNVWAIELPMSLAVVATNWNKPMHEYLKKLIRISYL
ncbi:hypothetical protein HUJ05_003180 [Dendroctonus ponderosae]|nr:hypothetical protein HUJ05_003180 [Dendroctonus ponderosae]